MPGLETAPAELEAMVSRTGVQGEKLLTGWENCCCQEGQMWQGQCCCPVSGREHWEGCDNLCSQAGSCPLLWRRICSRGCWGEQSQGFLVWDAAHTPPAAPCS